MAFIPITPIYKFKCDRCGREQYQHTNDTPIEAHHVHFAEWTQLKAHSTLKSGEVCEDCYNDFIELADNFFHEVNKEAET